jgi:hypothetical protein
VEGHAGPHIFLFVFIVGHKRNHIKQTKKKRFNLLRRMKLLLVLVGLIAVLLGAVVYHDGAPSSPNDFATPASSADGIQQTRTYARIVERVPIHHEHFEAWLYLPLPVPATKPPVIIMGPGLVPIVNHAQFLSGITIHALSPAALCTFTS